MQSLEKWLVLGLRFFVYKSVMDCFFFLSADFLSFSSSSDFSFSFLKQEMKRLIEEIKRD